MTKQEFEITPPKNIADQDVLAQLPEDIVKQLGKLEETGYDLKLSRRDLFFENGLVQYNPYRPQALVEIGIEDD